MAKRKNDSESPATPSKRAKKDKPDSAAKAAKAAKAADKAAKAAKDRVARVEKSEATLQQSIEHAQANNPQGVRVVGDVIFRDNQQMMAGYLGLKDTATLRLLLDDESISDIPVILKTWCRHKEKGFQVPDGGTNAPMRPSMFNLILKQGSIADAVLDAGIPLSPDIIQARKVVFYIVTMYSIVQARPTADERFAGCFPDVDDPNVPKALGGISPEDWNRALFLMGHYLKQSGAKKDKEGSGTEHNASALQVLYITKDDVQGVTKESSHNLTMGKIFSVGGDSDEDWSDDSDDENLTKEQRNERAIEEITKYEPINVNTKSYNRPKFDPASQAHHLMTMWERTTVLYPDKEILTKSFHGTGPLPRRTFNTIAFNRQAQTDAEAEAVLGEPDKVSEADIKAFWSFQRSLNINGAKHPSHAECMRFLRLDGTDQPFQKVTLFPHQVIGVGWLMMMSQSPFRGALCGYDTGLGKTVIASALIMLTVRKRELEGESAPKGPAVRYRPTLVVFPPMATQTWKTELPKLFPELKVYLYIGAKDQGLVTEHLTVLPKPVNDLVDFIRKLDPLNPDTGRVVILSTFNTFARRTMEKMDSEAPAAAPLDSDDIDDEDEDEEEEVSARVMRTLLPPGLFEYVIVDEAHRAKNPRTRNWQCVARLFPGALITLSATFLINKASDYFGLLKLTEIIMDLPNNGQESVTDEEENKSLEIYDEVSKELNDNPDFLNDGSLTMVKVESLARALNPSRFRKLAFTNAQMDPLTGVRVLQPITRLLQIKMSKGDEVEVDGVMHQVSDTLPPYFVHTIELKMPRRVEKKYVKLIDAVKLGQGADRRTGEAQASLTAVRDLTLAALNIHLPAVAGTFTSMAQRSQKLSAKAVKKWRLKFNDKGISFFWSRIRPSPRLPPYADRHSMGYVITVDSPKLQAMLGCIHGVVNVQKKKLLTFVGGPLALWHVEGIIDNAGFNVGSLRAGMGAHERDHLIAEFNDPNSSLQILLTTPAVGGSSYNLQGGCHHVLVLDVPTGTNTFLQMIGRVIRSGQLHEVIVWLMTLDHSWDQRVTHRSETKYMAQLAAFSALKITDEMAAAHLEAHLEAHPTTEESGFPITLEDARNTVFLSSLQDQYCAMMGQRSSRRASAWGELKDVFAKDALPEEKAFRQSLVEEPETGKHNPIDIFPVASNLRTNVAIVARRTRSSNIRNLVARPVRVPSASPGQSPFPMVQLCLLTSLTVVHPAPSGLEADVANPSTPPPISTVRGRSTSEG